MWRYTWAQRIESLTWSQQCGSNAWGLWTLVGLNGSTLQSTAASFLPISLHASPSGDGDVLSQPQTELHVFLFITYGKERARSKEKLLEAYSEQQENRYLLNCYWPDQVTDISLTKGHGIEQGEAGSLRRGGTLHDPAPSSCPTGYKKVDKPLFQT